MQSIATMADNLAAMRTALRVLTAILNHAEPDPTDVAELYRLAPDRPGLALDELACEVVHRLHEKRANADRTNVRGQFRQQRKLLASERKDRYRLRHAGETEWRASEDGDRIG